MNIFKVPRILISAPSSGSGKTTIVCGLLNALIKLNKNPACCKCGPDYIDSMFHNIIMGIKSINIDLFFSNKEQIKKLISENSQNSDITIIEGVMGFYDGIGANSYDASSYHIARETETPVIIIIKCNGASLTLAAILNGIINFKKDNNIKGVILNNIKKTTFDIIKPVIEKYCNIDVLGFINPLEERFLFKSRNLGLIIPGEINNIKESVDYFGDIVLNNINISKIIQIAKSAPDIVVEDKICNDIYINYNNSSKVKVGIAYDNAFCFYYRSNIDLLKKLGCEIKYFSPISDKEISNDIDGIIIGGGYPENYCEKLTQNEYMRYCINDKLKFGMPCLAECGGYMYLNKYINNKGKKYDMVGFFDFECFKTENLVRFGYINIIAKKNSYILEKGNSIKGHEFHYWDCTDNGNFFEAIKPSGKRKWDCINIKNNTVAGFPHIYYYSNIGFIRNFIYKCIESRSRR